MGIDLLSELPPVHNLLFRVTYSGVGPCRCVSIRFTSMKYHMNRLADIRHALGSIHSRTIKNVPDLQRCGGCSSPHCCAWHAGCSHRNADPFRKNNRMALEGTLHHISAMRDRHGAIIGLTYRIGRNMQGACATCPSACCHF